MTVRDIGNIRALSVPRTNNRHASGSIRF